MIELIFEKIYIQIRMRTFIIIAFVMIVVLAFAKSFPVGEEEIQIQLTLKNLYENKGNIISP